MEIAVEIKPFLVEEGYIDEDYRVEDLVEIASTFKTALNKFSEIVEMTAFIFERADNPVFYEDVVENIKTEDAKKVLEKMRDIVLEEGMNEELSKTIMKRVQKDTGIKGKSLFFPVRSALSGSEHGPEMHNIFMILGKDEIVKRINYVLENF